jgi:hypothetical protein
MLDDERSQGENYSSFLASTYSRNERLQSSSDEEAGGWEGDESTTYLLEMRWKSSLFVVYPQAADSPNATRVTEFTDQAATIRWTVYLDSYAEYPPHTPLIQGTVKLLSSSSR